MLSKTVKQFSFNLTLGSVSDGKKELLLLYLEFSILMFLSLPVILGMGFYALLSLEKSSEIFFNGWKTYFSIFESF